MVIFYFNLELHLLLEGSLFNLARYLVFHVHIFVNLRFLSQLKGFKTINVVRRDDQIEELKALGGDYVINSETTSIFDKVQEITKVPQACS